LKSKSLIQDIDNEIFSSIILFFEISIKMKIGKFSTNNLISDFIKGTKDSLISILDLKEGYHTEYQTIPLIENHRDPFDRILIAISKFENMPIISVDEKFSNYSDEIEVVW
jgi:PIN domain nuclease of toxin-antitoxin system